MKKTLSILLLAAALLCTACGDTAPAETSATTALTTADPYAGMTPEAQLRDQINALASTASTAEELKQLRDLVWDEYVATINTKQPSRKDEIRKDKTTKIKIGGTTMKVMTKVTGRAPEDGYPLFLVYHGGGYDPSGQTNESQWSGMAGRYASETGIFCSIRSVSDNESSGQIFSTDISWEFYDRIIENCILYMNANPNKVYIVGYSAGGNGVYQIAPRITDRLAAATMTAGHPEGIDLTNLYNLPFYLQVGELDTAYNRDTITVEYEQKLDVLAKKYGGGYYHKCFVHANKEHGVVGDNASNQSVIADNAAWLAAKQNGTAYTGGTERVETHAAKLMTTHTRDPLPQRIVWNTGTNQKSNDRREIDAFYWLSTSAQAGMIDASYDKATNTITFKQCSARRANVTIYLNEDMVDLFSPVKIVMPDGSVKEFIPEISADLLRETTKERGDWNYQFCASYTFKMN